MSQKNVIITVSNCELTEGMRNSGLIYNHWIDMTHRNFWTMESLVAMAIEAGFEITHKKYINQINIGHVAAEALGFSGKQALYLARIFKFLQRRK